MTEKNLEYLRTSPEMPQSVEDFLKQSNEIQEEIRKLSNLCEEISPSKPEKNSENKEEKEFWHDINLMLVKHGFSPIAGGIPTLSSISDTLIDVLTEFSSLKTSYKEIQFQLSKPLSSKFKRDSYTRGDSFEVFQEKYLNSKVDKSDILEEVKNILGVKDYTSIISDLKNIKKVMVTLPAIEKFINCVCKELIPDTSIPDYLDQALLKVNRLSRIQKEFEFVLEENIQMKKIVDYFCKLFDVRGIEKAMETIECVFYFVHEIKEFLDVRTI